MTQKPIAGKVASRVTTAAKDNKNFTVTASSAMGVAMGSGLISLTEKEGGVDTDNYKLEGKPNSTLATNKDVTGPA